MTVEKAILKIIEHAKTPIQAGRVIAQINMQVGLPLIDRLEAGQMIATKFGRIKAKEACEAKIKDVEDKIDFYIRLDADDFTNINGRHCDEMDWVMGRPLDEAGGETARHAVRNILLGNLFFPFPWYERNIKTFAKIGGQDTLDALRANFNVATDKPLRCAMKQGEELKKLTDEIRGKVVKEIEKRLNIMENLADQFVNAQEKAPALP